MASFSSHQTNASVVSYHTDKRGVTMSRAKFARAQPLTAVSDSPGPAAYYDKKAALQSPMFKGGIKFSLAKKPPGLFDVPASRVCPGPGAYNATGEKMLGVAAFRHIRQGRVVSPQGTVAKHKTPRSRRQDSSDGQHGENTASSSSSSMASSSVYSNHGPASHSKFPTSAKSRIASQQRQQEQRQQEQRQQEQSREQAGLNASSAGVSFSMGTQLSDISNVSGDNASTGLPSLSEGFNPAAQGFTVGASASISGDNASLEASLDDGKSASSGGGGFGVGPGVGIGVGLGVGGLEVTPESLRMDRRVVPGSLLRKLRSRLRAATFGLGIKVKRGNKKPRGRFMTLFAKADKNHDGFLDLGEVQSLFRRVLKFSPVELTAAQCGHVFAALDTFKLGRLAPAQLYALLGQPTTSRSGHEWAEKGAPVTQARRSTVSRHPTHPQHHREPPPAATHSQSVPFQPVSVALHPSDPSMDPSAVEDEAGLGGQVGRPPPNAALAEMLTDVKRLHGDFDSQLEELGHISHVLDELLNTMA